MSMPLFIRNMKSSIKLQVIFLCIILMYFGIIIWMYDPALSDMLTQYSELMPEMMAAVGMVGATDSLIAFINTYLYGFIMLIMPLVFEVLLINKLIMKYIDNGSLANLLSTPNSRKKIILTQMISIIINISILILLCTLAGYIFSESFFPGELDITKYISLNLSTLLLHFALSSIAVICACFVNENKWFLGIGVGLPLLFYIIQMIANMGDKLENFKYLTLYTLLPAKQIVEGKSGVISSDLILLAISLILYSIGYYRFTKRDLPL